MTPKEFKLQLYHEVALALIKDEETYDELAARFGISNRTIWEIGKRNGIKKRRGPIPKKKATVQVV